MKSIWSDDSWLHADTPINYLEEIWRHAALSKSWPVIHWISIGSKRFGFFWWYRFAPWETHWLPIKLNSKPNTAGAKTTLWKNHRRWREKQASHREALSHCHENSWNLLKLNLWSDWLYNPVQTLKPETKANMRGQTTKCLLSKRKEFEFKQLHRFWTQNTAALGWSLARPSLGSMSRLLLLLATVRQHKTPAKCWNVLKPEMKIRGKQKFKKRHRSCQELPPRMQMMQSFIWKKFVYWRCIRARWSIMSTLLSQSRLQTTWVHRSSIELDVVDDWSQMKWNILNFERKEKMWINDVIHLQLHTDSKSAYYTWIHDDII